jgi:hypothetical protein
MSNASEPAPDVRECMLMLAEIIEREQGLRLVSGR